MSSLENLAPGAEVAIRRLKQGRFRSYGYDYTYTTVTRITKTRIFVRAEHVGPKGEREFRKANLFEARESYNPAEILVDPAEIQAARDSQAAEKARKALETSGLAALATIKALFDMDSGSYNIERRSEAEINLLSAVAKALREPAPEAFEAARGALEALQATFESDGYPSDHAKLKGMGK